MSSIAKNISSNLLATAYVTILTLGVTPIQINILGIAAYGLIGFIATLQVIFIIFELGLSTIVTKYVAQYSSQKKSSFNDVLGTAMSLYWISAVFIGFFLIASSGFIANYWIKSESIGLKNLERCLFAISCYLAVRWPVSFYSGVLVGMQKINIANLIKMTATTVRLLGGVGLLFLFPNLEVFLWWMAIIGALEILFYVGYFKKNHISTYWKIGVSFSALKEIGKFSVSIGAISILGLIISQLDRIMGSKMLSMEEFGYYTIAYSAASAISLIISSISSAIFPSFSLNHGALDVLIRQYKYANELLIFFVGFAVFPFVFYGDVILRLWIGERVVQFSYVPLALLAIGFWCSAALANAYNLTIALGRPGVTLRLSAISVIPYAILLYYLLRTYGINGAAFSWVVLNLFYLIILTFTADKTLLKIATCFWSIKTIAPLLFLGCAIFSFSRFLAYQFFYLSQIALESMMALSVFAYAFFGYYLLDSGIKLRLMAILVKHKTNKISS